MSKPDPLEATILARALQHGRSLDRWPTWELWSMEAMWVLPLLLARVETMETALRALAARWRDTDTEGHAHDPAVAFNQGLQQCADELEAALAGEEEHREG